MAIVLASFIVVIMMQSMTWGMSQVGLYDVWERQVINTKKYSNPFDYNVIELQATFTSPSGKKFNFFGFYDGNGNGGQTGDVWKLRFMPDKVGTWKYTYRWTDGTSGGSGSFQVVDTGLPGPLKVASDNSWYFENARGRAFDLRGYDVHQVATFAPRGNPYTGDRSWFKNIIQKDLAEKGYNFTMISLPADRVDTHVPFKAETLWVNEQETKVFDVSVWQGVDSILGMLKDKKIYTITFAGMIFHNNAVTPRTRPGGVYNFNDFKVLIKYFVARYGAFYNFLGWSPAWEWHDAWTKSEVNTIMAQVDSWDPFDRLYSIHDCSHNGFSWLDFSMRQTGSRSVFDGNARQANWTQFGDRHAICGSSSGVGSKFVNQPIVGSEDLWEGTLKGQPRNGTEVRRGAWGGLLAGVMPLYSEWNKWLKSGGGGQGEPYIRRMLDFVYSKTQYRQYKQLNGLVSKSSRQVASGKEGQEYLVYDENGGDIVIDLSDAGGSNTFDVLWYNPTSGSTKDGGKVNGGASRTLHSPISGDTVLLLTKGKADTTPPKAPTKLSIRSVER
ncbi:DUF5060 domain-containing protein [Nitrospira sp. M1]